MLQFLLLEDDPNDIELISTALANSELEIDLVTVETQDDFLAALTHRPIDLVLADYALPNFDGLTAMEMGQQRYPDIPFILVSGVLGEDRAIEALQLGATDYILKQRLERLVPAVQRALKEKQERLELKQAVQSLRESEERFRTSVETMTDCFAICLAVRDRDNRIEDFNIRYINQAACEYLSISQVQQEGQTLCSVMPAAKQSELFDGCCWVVETGQSLTREVMLYGQETASAAQQFAAIDVRASKLGDGLVVTWRDITERKQEESRRKQLFADAQAARKQAEQASRFKDEFLAVLSHELRTPLNAISGWVQLLQSKSPNAQTLGHAIGIIQRNTEALTQLIEDILDVSRIVRGKLRLNIQQLSLSDQGKVIEAAIETVRPAAEAKNIQINFQSGDRGGLTAVDPNRLQQVVWNLLSNAVKFTSEHGQVQVDLEIADGHMVLQVSDSGQGIEPDALPYIFERFRQVDGSSTRSQNGLGLGLAIVKHIVELHGGEISAQSPGLGQGTTFTLKIPLAAETETAADESKTLEHSGAPLSRAQVAESPEAHLSLANIRVLIVEDAEDARTLYTMMLEEFGAEVRAAASVTEALSLFTEQRPHVLVSDISMPTEDGYSLIRRIRQLTVDEGGQTPAVALTAYTRPEDRTRALLAGFQLHVPKPVDLIELAAVVSTLAQGADR
ncbi:response regulator [Romeria aff. gracilis LEGE 07310]|uniref:histidine kinase n=1 Tax=Vasconcelosia minhoensis LEGE 07310 TaxID=915328 RepID=A0A8J7AC92_9CYAN|nr:response regulator [Romeria gracilis]MBE9080395.1 response regulator [Romeria aff. gracilis LEGE 07310]